MKAYTIVFITTLVVIILLVLGYILKAGVTIESFDTKSIPIYYINLDTNKDRRTHVETQAREQNLSLIRFPAIHGKHVDVDQLQKTGLLARKHSLLAGQLGCALSHYQLLEKIYAQGDALSIVLEDDIILPPHVMSSIYEMIHSLPKKWDIVFLGGCNIMGNRIASNLIQPTRYNSSYNLCTHAYLVRHESIPHLLKQLTPLYRPIDSQWRDKFRNLDVFYIYPNLITQSKDIRSTRRDLDGLPQSKFWNTHHGDITILNSGTEFAQA